MEPAIDGSRRRSSQDDPIELMGTEAIPYHVLGTALISEHDMSVCELALGAADAHDPAKCA
ncbi:hypothetical protein MSG28_012334 [Choristoneura fumiferana]|uniref:Uncharacterized protein n=1 Tax=Choristoneura fumiferana TaxID=7141 RepID=A0ACC0KCZ7_CHOFU|nr:hypothetical protein MSG28_012334 [Choristoneura fumiferana]